MNIKRALILLIGISAVFLFVYAIKEKTQTKTGDTNKMLVSASFYPLAYLAEEVGGNNVEVANITPAGAEPHDYEPSPQAIAKITESKVLILNGRGLEAWGNNIKQNIDPTKTAIVMASDGLPSQNISEDGKTMLDPHVLLDPLITKQIADTIERAFEKADPKNKAVYEKNLSILNVKLDALDQSFREGLANCAKKDIITSHAAFGYLATEYGLTQVPIAGLSPDAEPSPRQLSDIVTFVRKNNVSYIFFESLASPKLSDTIANEVGARTLVLNPLEGLTKKELSEGKNYISVMRENLANLQTALLCTKQTPLEN